MSEALEGILSEAVLDALSSDLGIDPDDMRKHPFFRVLKGRVLLTYPLRVPAIYGWVYTTTVDADFDSTDTVVMDEDEELVWAQTSTNNNLLLEMYDGGDWRDLEDHNGVAIQFQANLPLVFSSPIRSAAAGQVGSLRLAGEVDDDTEMIYCSRVWGVVA